MFQVSRTRLTPVLSTIFPAASFGPLAERSRNELATGGRAMRGEKKSSGRWSFGGAEFPEDLAENAEGKIGISGG